MLSSVEIGRRAEQAAADWLERFGYRIVDRNWRTRYCEIDIVALRGGRLHFVEVKYRRSTAYGEGFEYVTPSKRQRLRRAATAWMYYHNAGERPYQIDIISLSGFPEPKNLEYLPNAVGSG